MHAVQYSFNFRYQRDIAREVIIPLEKLAEINLLDHDLNRAISKLINNDPELLDALLGDFAQEYLEMLNDYEIYAKDLERERERAVIIIKPLES